VALATYAVAALWLATHSSEAGRITCSSSTFPPWLRCAQIELERRSDSLNDDQVITPRHQPNLNDLNQQVYAVVGLVTVFAADS